MKDFQILQANEAACVQGLERYEARELCEMAQEHFEKVVGEPTGCRVTVVMLYGSRVRGEAGPNSDLDVIVVYEGHMPDYACLDILCDEPLTIDGIRVDFNPKRNIDGCNTLPFGVLEKGGWQQ